MKSIPDNAYIGHAKTMTMRRIIGLISTLLLFAACQKATSKPSYIVQVSLGSWNTPLYSAGQIIGKIDTVTQMIPVEKVIIGWSLDKGIYKEVGEYLHSRNIQMLYWLPVFAETEEVCQSVPSVDLWGKEPANFDLTAGEGFRFNCPSSKDNAAGVIAIYDKYLSDCGFDGVFIDRIRTQSFVGGLSGVLSCGCGGCAQLFKEEGVNLEDVRKALEEKGDSFFSVSGYDPKEGFLFTDPLAGAFIKAKGHIVSNGVAAVADSLRSRGLIVGMDLFAPFMAPFVGQDYEILSAHADFIKPMLYRCTNAPAGMGFEYESLKSTLPGAEGYPDFEMDVRFLESQLEAMSESACPVYPGLEINYRKDIAPTTPEYVKESLDAIMKHGGAGAVLSWNIMEAPLENIPGKN